VNQIRLKVEQRNKFKFALLHFYCFSHAEVLAARVVNGEFFAELVGKMGSKMFFKQPCSFCGFMNGASAFYFLLFIRFDARFVPLKHRWVRGKGWHLILKK
jgi:hypothetical protein